MIIAAVIRTYHMRDLAVFLADQASDSTAVFNILKGDFTLLGPITSVGGFYNGPIVYYLMAPIFWIFKSNPLSGTIFQTLIFCFTIPFIYFIGKKVWNVETGLLAGFIFAISPLMVEYSRAAFNSFPAIFFSTLIIYLLISLQKPFSNIKLLMIGVFIGWILQMHYFTVAFVLLVSIYPLFRRELFSWKYYLFTMFGIGIGFAPFLLFEIRHQFLNTHRMIEYFITAPDDTIRSLNNIFMIWPRVMGEIIGNNNIFMGLLFFLMIGIYLGNTFHSYKKNHIHILLFLLLFFIVTIIGAIYGKRLESHYVISFHTSLIIFFSATMISLLRKNKLIIGVFVFCIMLINIPSWGIAAEKHPVQDGLSIKDFTYAASLIHDDNKQQYNVAMHAQGDNRAMPLRYTLLLLDDHPQHYDTYTNIAQLYFIVPKDEGIQQQTMWEYTAFGPSRIANIWNINEEYYLYKLEKQDNNIVIYNSSTH